MSNTSTSTRPATIAQDVLARLETAWNRGDGAAYGAVFAPDASFVTVRGEHLTGRQAIGAGHAGIFAGIYVGSVNRLELVRADEVSPGVVRVISAATLSCPTGPLAGVHRAMSTNIVVADPAGNQPPLVVASQNTLVASAG